MEALCGRLDDLFCLASHLVPSRASLAPFGHLVLVFLSHYAVWLLFCAQHTYPFLLNAEIWLCVFVWKTCQVPSVSFLLMCLFADEFDMFLNVGTDFVHR